ncbi:hypothetical protein BD414DRAFT_473210 [Trametes punicea]|nr:hypothetical protein BD414DRAFT_473210 [Trametes punicea]
MEERERGGDGGGNEGAGMGGGGGEEGEDRSETRHEAAREAANRADHRLPSAAHRPLDRPHPYPPPSPPSPVHPPSTSTSSPAHLSPRLPTSTASPSPPTTTITTTASSSSQHPIPSSSTSSPQDARMPHRALLALLHCPRCSPPALLRTPVTLHCGHTFCAAHFTSPNAPSTSNAQSSAPLLLPACPLPTCSFSSRAPPAFSHPPPLDVTVNKVLDVLLSVPGPVVEPTPPPSFHDDSDDRTDSEYEVDSSSDLEYLPLPPLSSETGESQHPSAVRNADPVEHVPRSSSPPVSSHPRSRSRSPSSPHLHPRKRRRRIRPRLSPPHSHPPPHRSDHDRQARIKKELLSELTCEICFGLLWQPITTPCQHTFCTRCLFRSLDHSQTCPLCRQRLPGYDYFQQHPCNKVILAIILEAFPDAYAERGATIEAEEHDARLNTPVFVCQLSFPGMPTMLHFFEPRYRLMLRRCMESPNPSFGMIPPPRAASSSSAGVSSTGNDYGTMLAIRNVHTLPDGRSLVETWGTWRFRIMERGTLDGYMVARVERIEDYEEELDESADAPEGEDRSEDGLGDSISRTGAPGEDPGSLPAGERRSAPAREEELLEAVVRTELSDAVMDAQSPSSSPLRSHPGAIGASLPSRELPCEPQHSRSEERDTPMDRKREPEDAPTSLPAAPRAPTNAELMAKCHAFIEQMREGTPWVVQHLNNIYVPMPSDPASFSFWMAPLLPIDEHEKAKLLPIRSPRLRLRLVVHWIEQLQSNWWFSGGCVVC